MDLLKEFDYKWNIGTGTCTKEKELDWTEQIFGEKHPSIRFIDMSDMINNYLKTRDDTLKMLFNNIVT